MKYQLVSEHLGMDIGEYALELRAAGQTWQSIAQMASEDSGVRVGVQVVTWQARQCANRLGVDLRWNARAGTHAATLRLVTDAAALGSR